MLFNVDDSNGNYNKIIKFLITRQANETIKKCLIKIVEIIENKKEIKNVAILLKYGLSNEVLFSYIEEQYQYNVYNKEIFTMKLPSNLSPKDIFSNPALLKAITSMSAQILSKISYSKQIHKVSAVLTPQSDFPIQTPRKLLPGDLPEQGMGPGIQQLIIEARAAGFLPQLHPRSTDVNNKDVSSLNTPSEQPNSKKTDKDVDENSLINNIGMHKNRMT